MKHPQENFYYSNFLISLIGKILFSDSSLKIEVGKRFVSLKPKDWFEYILSRAKRGKKVGKLINIERLTEEIKISQAD